MPLEDPYCTVQNVRDEIRNSDSTLTSQIEDAINRASRWIDDYVGRDFFQHDHSVTALVIDKWDDVIFDDVLFLQYRPIITLTEVKSAGKVLTSGTDYRSKDNRIISLIGTWPRGTKSDEWVELKGKFGYAQNATTDVPTGMPKHITHAAVLVAAAWCGQNRKEIVGLEGNKEEVIDKLVPKTVFDILGTKRKVVL